MASRLICFEPQRIPSPSGRGKKSFSLSFLQKSIIGQPASLGIPLSESIVSLQSLKLIGKGRSLFLYLALFIISMAGAMSVLAQTSGRGWEWQNPLPQGNAINAIRFARDKL